MLTAGGCVLLVHPDGSTSFSFENETCLPEVRSTAETGAGIYLPTNVCKPPLLSDTPLTRLGVGKYKTHLCFQCFCVIAKGTRAKQRIDCPGLSFCSSECLEGGSACLDLCSAYLFALAPAQGLKPQAQAQAPSPSPQPDVSSGVMMADLQQLALLACCNAILGPGNQIMQSLHLTLGSAYYGELEPAGDVLAAADDILAFAQSPQGRGKLRRFLVDGLGRGKLARLLAALKYNAQVLPVLQLPGTSVLCFLPTLSKLNHSCAPNSVLVREDFGPGSALPFTVRLHMTESPFRAIDRDRELTISYLANLCCSRRDRQALLQAAFHFRCRCGRCEAEKEEEEGGDDQGGELGAWLSAAMSERDWRADTIAAALEAVRARVLSDGGSPSASLVYAAHPLLMVYLQQSMRLRDNRLVGRCTMALVRLLEMGGGVSGQPGVVELLARGAEALWSHLQQSRGAGASEEELAGGRDLAQRALRYLCDWHGRDATAAALHAHVSSLSSRLDSYIP